MENFGRKLCKPKDVGNLHPTLNPQRLARLRLDGGGPAYIKLGRSVFYDQRDINHWLDVNRHNSTSETPEVTNK